MFFVQSPSSDGRTIITGSGDNTIKVWNSETAELLHTLEGHSGQVTSVAISRDGKTIVSGSGDINDNTIKVWNSETAELLHTLEGHSDNSHNVRRVAVSGNGSIIIANYGTGFTRNYIKVWNLKTGETFKIEGYFNDIAISSDGKTIVGGRANLITIW